MSAPVRLGLRANAGQFSLLVGLNALVGAMVGLERSVLPLVGERDFGLASKGAILAFVVAFGLAKALTNLAAGGLAERVGRRRLLIIGWLLALPEPVLIGLAPSWGWIVAANLLLGANQGLAWSMTVIMKIDLAGPARRGLALGLNESAGYLGVAATAFATGALAASFAPRTVVWAGAAVVAGVGTLIAVLFVRDTGAHVAQEQRAHGSGSAPTLRAAFAGGTLSDPVLRACSQAGLVNNLNDALAWGLTPLYLARTARARIRSLRSPRSTRPCGEPGRFSPAGSPTPSGGSRSSSSGWSSRRGPLPCWSRGAGHSRRPSRRPPSSASAPRSSIRP
jgi:MFS family permease